MPWSFYDEERLGEHFSNNDGCFTDSRIQYGRGRAKTLSRRTKHEQNVKTQCVDLRADTSIRKAAIAAGDSRIIGLASCDLVAAEAWYPGQCYQDYTQPNKACKYSDLDDEPDSDETKYCNIEFQANDKLF